MDLLRFLLLLPLRLLRGLGRGLAWLLRPLFGRIAWSAPPWMPATEALVRRRPWHVGGGVLLALALITGGWFGWQWYRHRPLPVEPDLVTFQVQAPGLTQYTVHPAQVQPLLVQFSRSAAPLALVGKPVSAGFVLRPALKGNWHWLDDRNLQFDPAEDWPVGQRYEVRWDKAKAFAPKVLLHEDDFAFQVTPFEVSLGQTEFYQDPQSPTAKKTIMQLAFNYPVDPQQLESRIALELRDRHDRKVGDALRYSVSYDADKLHAWIHSEPLALPRDDGSVHLQLAAGVASSRGGAASAQALEGMVKVPGLYSLTIGDIQPTLVDNDKYEPEQVLVMNVGGDVRDSDLTALTHAWVLPHRNAKREGKLDADAPPYDWAPEEVSEAVLRQSRPLTLEPIPAENDYQAIQSFKFHAEPGERIYVRVGQGLKSFGGYVMGRPRVELFAVPDYPKLLSFMADGSLLSLSGSKRVSVVSRNLPGLRMEIGRVLPDQLQHLVSLSSAYGKFSQPQLNDGFSEDHIVDHFEQKISFPDAGPTKAHYEGVDLGQYLKDGKRGVFLLHLSAYDRVAEQKQAEAKRKADQAEAGEAHGAAPAQDAASDGQEGDADEADSEASDPAEGQPADRTSDTRLVVVTDLGLLVKRALDGSQDVFVQSIGNGKPVEGANVSVVALNGQVLFNQLSGADGVVHFPSLKGLQREKRPVMYLVKKADDLSFLPIGRDDRQLDYSRFDVGGEPNAVDQGRLSAYLYSDRGIYRPGDTFHIGLIVRAASWSHQVAGVPLQAEVVDPRGVTVKQWPLSLDASGFGELAYTPAETAATGGWTVNLYITRRNGERSDQIGSTTVQVKEFLPDRMKVVAKLSQQVAEGWVKPAQLKAQVDVENLFGTPAADRRIEASLTLRPAWPAFRSWPQFQFYDSRRAKEGYEENLQDGKSDAQGHAEFPLDLAKYADATYELYFLAKAYEADGGRNVAAAAQTLVSANDWLVGYKALDSLDYIARGAARSVRLVAIGPDAKSIALGQLKARLLEHRYVSVLTRQDSGVYKYESKPKDLIVGEQPLSIADGGMDYPLATDRPGDYSLAILRADGTEVNRVNYSVMGDGNVARSLDRNAELQIRLDKRDYKPGESVEVAIRAPYAGSGVITIERDKVYAHAWFHADGNSSVQHITVPAGFEGNGYVNVQYIRDPASDEIFMSPLSYGVVPFSVNLDARRAELKLDAPALVKPGQSINFKLGASRPTKAVVWAVDEGILQVARYKLGDPLAYFFRKRALDVRTSQILDLILPDFAKLVAMAAPGGDADGAIGRQLNPFKRKRDLPVVYWSGIVDVDGEHDFSYSVPDYFNGKLRVMAMAVSPEQIGSVEAATTVRGDFVLSPNVPTTLAPGDEAQVSVGVANNLSGLDGKSVPVAVKLEVGPGLQVIGAASQNVSLAPMREGVLRFRVKATDQLGSARLSFTAGYADKQARQAVELSVRPAVAYRSEVTLGELDASDKTDIADLRALYPQYAQRQVAMAGTPLVLTQGLSAYLTDFPHYCTEQILSRALPGLIFGQRAEFASVLRASTDTGPFDQAKALASLFDQLHARQNAAGGFGVWQATPDGNTFLTDYGMLFMLEARDRGQAVPRDMFDAATTFLRHSAAADGQDSLDSLREQAYAIYLLTRQGVVTTNYLASLQQRLEQGYADGYKADTTAVWLAASYQLLKQDREAARLIEAPRKALLKTGKDGDWHYGYYDDPLIRNASTLYVLAKHFPELAKGLPPDVLQSLLQPLKANRFNTLSSAMTILALDAYGDLATGDSSKLDIAAVRKDGQSSSIGQLQGILRTAGWTADAARLRLSNGGGMPAWYAVEQRGYDRVMPTKPLSQGFEIVREYTDANGKALDKITVGQEIDVHLKVRSTSQQSIADVALVDLLPGGFDPVLQPPPAATVSADANADAADDSVAAASTWRSPIGLARSSWHAEYADIREDRVVIYGTVEPGVREFVYRIKATNAGSFVVPPAFGESMYDRSLQARAPAGARLTVVDP